MRRTEEVELTNMCMIQMGDYVLVQDKSWREYRGIVFPGGHVEKHESFVDSLIREIKEETGLTISKPKLVGIKNFINEDDSRYMVLLYETNSFIGSIQSSDEGKVFWVHKDELKNKNLIWNMEEIIEIYLGKEFTELYIETKNDAWDPILK